MFLCFVKNNTNYIFFPCIYFNFGIEKTSNDCFFPCIILQFNFFLFLFLWKSITTELFPCVRFHILWFLKNYTILVFSLYCILIFVDLKTTRDCFSRCVTLQFNFLFLWKYIRTELLPRIRLHFLWFCEKQYKCGFFHVKRLKFMWFCYKNKTFLFSMY